MLEGSPPVLAASLPGAPERRGGPRARNAGLEACMPDLSPAQVAELLTPRVAGLSAHEAGERLRSTGPDAA